jgi:hypothetical protein
LRDFGIATSSPWAIAWLIKADDWEHLEEVIHHNCTLLGGTDNIVVPVSEDGIIWPGFELFLSLYDPDFIVLPPGVEIAEEATHHPNLLCVALFHTVMDGHHEPQISTASTFEKVRRAFLTT